jgi:WD40 repeat protein
VAWHPDGRALASCGDDKTIRLWDLAGWRTGEANPPVRALEGHDGGVESLAWRADGRVLASHSRKDGTVRLWDVTGTPPRSKVLKPFPTTDQTWLPRITFTPEGRHLAVANPRGTVYVLRLAKPGEVFQVHAEPEK